MALLRAAAELAPQGVEIVIYPLDDVPLYNGDLDPKDQTGAPPAIRAFRQAVAESDALIAATPEFSHSYTGVLKNALDWLAHADVLDGMPVTSISTAPNLGGGVRGQMALREVYFACGAITYFELLVRLPQQKFDAEGTLTDAETRQQLTTFLAKFADQARKSRIPA